VSGFLNQSCTQHITFFHQDIDEDKEEARDTSCREERQGYGDFEKVE
jgi:hypothetical protein